MTATIEITVPQALFETLAPDPQTLPREMLEAYVIQAYIADKLSNYQLGQILGLESRWDVDKFLKDHKVPTDWQIEEYKHDLERFRKYGK